MAELPSFHGKTKGSFSVYLSRACRFSIAASRSAFAAFISVIFTSLEITIALAVSSACENSLQPSLYQAAFFASLSLISSLNSLIIPASASLIVTLELLLNPRPAPPVGSVRVTVKYLSPDSAVFLNVVTVAVFSVSPSSNVKTVC